MDHVDHTEKQGKEEQAAAPFSKMESHKSQIDPITYAEYGKDGKQDSNQSFTCDHTGGEKDTVITDGFAGTLIGKAAFLHEKADQTTDHDRNCQVNRQIQSDGKWQNRDT